MTDETSLIHMLEEERLGTRRRRQLLSKLREVATDGSIDVLRKHLQCSDVKCRVRAVLALSRIGTEAAIDALGVTLEEETGPPLTFAVKAIGDSRSTRSVPTLIHMLDDRRDELDDGDKIVIMHALLKMPHKGAVPVLSETLYEGHRKTRRAAAMALAQIRAPESRAALEEAATSMSWFKAASVRRALRWRTQAYNE